MKILGIIAVIILAIVLMPIIASILGALLTLAFYVTCFLIAVGVIWFIIGFLANVFSS